MLEFSVQHTGSRMVRNKPRAAGRSSEPRSTGFHVSAAAAASCCVVAFSLGWGVRDTYPDLFGWASLALAAWRRTAATHPDTAAGGVGAPYGYNPWEFTTHPTMASDGFNWTQLSMGRVNNFRKGEDGEPAVMQMGAHEVEQMGAFALFQKTYSRAVPAKITGLANQWSERISQWRLRDFREHWGEKTVQASFSPDKLFQRGHYVDDAVGRTLQMPPRYSMSFGDFLDHDAALKGSGEHVAVTQSPSRDLSEFNLPSLPPHLESLVGPTLNARNFWAASAPKVSVLHYDWQDSVLLQLSGRKRFTLIDPARMQAAYPAVMKQERLVRDAPGKYSRVGTSVEIDNFPLVNLTHPDLERHPLFNDAQMMTVELAPVATHSCSPPRGTTRSRASRMTTGSVSLSTTGSRAIRSPHASIEPCGRTSSSIAPSPSEQASCIRAGSDIWLYAASAKL